MSELHVILSTHTTLHLRRCLLGCAAQARRADSITLSCDVVSEDILRVVESACVEFGISMLVVQRTHTGQARCSQVRNNAVRALLAERATVPGGSRLVFLDGDTCPAPNALAMHAKFGGRDRLVSAYRVNLTPEQTDAFDENAIRAGREPVALTTAQRDELRERDARYRRQMFWRSLGLGKAHKPRLLGGHFSVPLEAYCNVNGCDEEYEGYGQEDDDLARRLHRAGYKSVVGVRDIVVYHLYHPTRAPGNWDDAPGVARFQMNTPTRASRGLEKPAAQPDVKVYRVRPGVREEARIAPAAR